MTDCRCNSPEDIPQLLSASFLDDGLLLEEKELGPAFFDLSSGLAGELFQKLQNYQCRLALVIADPDIYGDSFRDLAREHARHPLIRFFTSRREAEAWLRQGA